MKLKHCFSISILNYIKRYKVNSIIYKVDNDCNLNVYYNFSCNNIKQKL